MRGNDPKYWLEYALMLQQQNEKEEAFQTALKLSNYQNTKILKEYGKFLMECKGQKEKGRQFMQWASKINAIKDPNTGSSKNVKVDNICKSEMDDIDEA